MVSFNESFINVQSNDQWANHLRKSLSNSSNALDLHISIHRKTFNSYTSPSGWLPMRIGRNDLQVQRVNDDRRASISTRPIIFARKREYEGRTKRRTNLCVCLVHCSEVDHVCQVDIEFEDVFERGTRRGENFSEVQESCCL